MTIKDEIKSKRQEIHTDSYQMSLGEIANMYRDGDLNLRPEFQRYFRWSDHQMTRLIESILLGIPLPSIFVSQDDDGRWDVIDGLQRLSTILKFMGLLRDEDDKKTDPLVLCRAKYLPSLEGLSWETSSPYVQRLIKRAPLGVTIILRESDRNSKYELFERLNTGGTALSEQEVRNCILVMIDKKYLDWVQDLAEDANFKRCISFSPKQKAEQADLDLVVRYLVLRDYPLETLSDSTDMGTLFTDRIVELLTADNFDTAEAEASFRFAFSTLAESLEGDALKRYNPTKKKFEGAWTHSAFEVIAVGIGHNFRTLSGRRELTSKSNIVKVAKKLWTSDSTMRAAMSRGVRPANRMKMTVQLGREVFSGKSKKRR